MVLLKCFSTPLTVLLPFPLHHWHYRPCWDLFCVIAFITIIFTIVRQLVWGWLSLWLVFSGMYYFISVRDTVVLYRYLGQYLSKTYLEAKKRPIYIVREKSGGNNESE